MGHQAIVYGRIQGARIPQGCQVDFVHVYNRLVIQSIPDRDSDWPFLTRHMFAVAENSIPDTRDRGLYKSQIIHFGASFKDIPDQDAHWDDWLTKFEAALTHLLWISAKVHIETDFRPERIYLYRNNLETLREMLAEVEHTGYLLETHATWTRDVIDRSDIEEDWLL